MQDLATRVQIVRAIKLWGYPLIGSTASITGSVFCVKFHMAMFCSLRQSFILLEVSASWILKVRLFCYQIKYSPKTSDTLNQKLCSVPISCLRHCLIIKSIQGEIYTENSIVQHCTYAEIYEHNEVYFPILRPDTEEVEEEYLAQNFWRSDIPDLDEDDLILWCCQ